MPSIVKWVIIGASIVIMAGCLTILYIFTHPGKKGLSFSLGGSEITAICLGPGIIFLAIVIIILAVMCHRHRIKRQQREDQVRLELSQNGINYYNLHTSDAIT